MLSRIHHIAIICSNYKISKQIYTEVLGLTIIQEIYRVNRQSYKLDLSLNGELCIELFAFPNPPNRPSYPKSTGLRHIAFEVENLQSEIDRLTSLGIIVEHLRTDEFTGKRFAFFKDPDHLPIEIYEIN